MPSDREERSNGTKFTRAEGASLVVLGVIFCAGGYALGYLVNIDGITFAAFNFAIVLGGFMVLLGLVALTGVLNRR